LRLVTCGAGSVSFDTVAGRSYWLVAIDDTPAHGHGGTLRISVTEPPPPPEVRVTARATGTVDPRSGVATVSGRFTCSARAEAGDVVGEVVGELRQTEGGMVVQGVLAAGGLACDGTTRR
jgi:hypothetical protein